MTNCDYCHLPKLDGQSLDDNGNHEVCGIEWYKRYNAGMCVGCGKNSKISSGVRCSDCYDNNSDYSGYEGPGQ